MEQLRTFVTQLGRGRLAAMAGVAMLMLAALAFVATRGGGGEKPNAYLFTDLDPSVASSIADKLKSQNVAFTLSPDGTAIMAPESKLAELRMAMAGQKLGGKIGYEVLDQEEPFGVSASRAKLNETRAIEGELARSIQTLDGVSGARVHIVMPAHELFSSDGVKASAAVTLKTKGRLSAEAVQSIRYLVSSSVPALSPEAVSIVDQTGALLARAGEAGALGGGDNDQRQTQIEGRMRDEIEALLQPIVGEGKVRAEVSADVDRDQTREESDVFDPEKQVIAHQVTVGTKDQKSEAQPSAQTASVGAQLPEARGQNNNGPAGPTSNAAHDESNEDTTYENSKTHSVVLRGPGRIKRLTVAVMIDGGEKGLAPAMTQRLTRLVENAVGADTGRGDSVVVESMRFAADTGLADAAAPGLLSKLPLDRLWDVAKLALIAAAGLIALRTIRPRPDPATDHADHALDGPANGGVLTPSPPEIAKLQSQAAAGDPVAQARLEALQAGADPETLDDEIALAQIDGRLKKSALQRVGDAVSASPPEAAAVIRQWMNA